MNPVEQIDLPQAMQAQAAKVIFSLLGRGNVYFVGGCVRNAVIDQEVTDLDMATIFRPEDTMQKLEQGGVRVVPTGIDHGTVTAVIDETPIEITTLRKDVETDGRRALVAFSKDWKEDSQRRDFTMNTLLADDQGQVFDPLGVGLSDLKAGQVVFVGEPSARIAEDHLRILRFFRFHALYGQGGADPQALKACAEAAPKVLDLSKERITQELFKILSHEDPAPTLDLMFENGVLKLPVFEEYDSKIFSALCFFQKRYGLASLSSRLLLLGNVEGLNDLLLIPKIFQKDIQAILKAMEMQSLKTEHATKHALYKCGRVPTAQALMLQLATDKVANQDAPAAIDLIQNWDIPNFPISGEELIAKGFRPGPALGAELERLEEEWISSGFRDNR